MGPVGYFLDSLLCSKGQHNTKTMLFFSQDFYPGSPVFNLKV